MDKQLESYITNYYLNENEDLEVIIYGLKILLQGFLMIMILGILGIVTNYKKETLVFLICSIIGIGTMGGYHCNRLRNCILLTFFLWFTTIGFSDLFNVIINFIGIRNIEFILFLAVLLLAPAEHINKPLEKVLKIKLKTVAICEFLFAIILVTSFYNTDQRLANILLINIVEVVISMIIGKGVNINAKRKNGKTNDSGC